jgi:hypothetical protein
MYLQPFFFTELVHKVLTLVSMWQEANLKNSSKNRSSNQSYQEALPGVLTILYEPRASNIEAESNNIILADMCSS